MRFVQKPRDERAQIVRDLAAQGMSRRGIAKHLDTSPGSIDSLCYDYRIKTTAPTPLPPPVGAHPNWEREGDFQRRWFQKMDKAFVKAMRASLASSGEVLA